MYARQAITTKYHGPTNTRGARISARCAAGRITISRHGDNDALDGAELHAKAITALIAKLGWDATAYSKGAWHMGATTDGYCAVYSTSDTQIVFTTTTPAPAGWTHVEGGVTP